MRNLIRLADRIGNDLAGAGYALEDLGNLLGADGSEHHINKDDANGLQHAVVAISAYIRKAATELCVAVEEEQEGGAQ